jgi:hypothetical protein
MFFSLCSRGTLCPKGSNYRAPTIGRVNIVTDAATTASVAAGGRHKINAFETRITYSGEQLGIIFIII